mgnify:CR=1 FL=1
MKRFYSHGKLLISGEYVVLDGALALAVPTKFGQSLKVETISDTQIIWESLDNRGQVWFKDEFLIKNTILQSASPENDISQRLLQILNTAKQLNPYFLNSESGFKITTALDFPKNWGLGTSSTLINNIAQWAGINAYTLLEKTFGGSGYDIACAQNDTAITYQLQNGQPAISPVAFNPTFKEHLYFVHLNRKQNSRAGITYYNSNKTNLSSVISEIKSLTSQILVCSGLSEFKNLLHLHETIIARVTKQQTIKSLFFSNFKGSIKSLGAWGGDFILVAHEVNPVNYFKSKGFNTVIPYSKMMLSYADD